jgi:hypothetical protein
MLYLVRWTVLIAVIWGSMQNKERSVIALKHFIVSGKRMMVPEKA